MYSLIYNYIIVISIVLVCINDVYAVECHDELINAGFIDGPFYITLRTMSNNTIKNLRGIPRRYYLYLQKFDRLKSLSVCPKTFCSIIECEERLKESNDTTSWHEGLGYGEEYNELFKFYGLLINYGTIGSGKYEHIIRAKCTMHVCIDQLREFSLGSGVNNIKMPPKYIIPDVRNPIRSLFSFQGFYLMDHFTFARKQLPGTLVFCLSATYEVQFEYSPYKMQDICSHPHHKATSSHDKGEPCTYDVTTKTNYRSITTNSRNEYRNAEKYNSVILDYTIFLEDNVGEDKELTDQINYFGRPKNYSLLRACINEAKLISANQFLLNVFHTSEASSVIVSVIKSICTWMSGQNPAIKIPPNEIPPPRLRLDIIPQKKRIGPNFHPKTSSNLKKRMPRKLE